MQRYAPTLESAQLAPAAPGDEWLVFEGFAPDGSEVYSRWRVPDSGAGMGFVTALIQAGLAIGTAVVGSRAQKSAQEKQAGATYEQEAKAAADAYTAVQSDALAGKLSEQEAAAYLAQIDARLEQAAQGLASAYTQRKHAEYKPMFDSRRPVILQQARENYRGGAGPGAGADNSAVAGLPSWLLPAALAGAAFFLLRGK